MRVEYYEWEFDVTFSRKGQQATYSFLDRVLHNHFSGLQGTMFSPDKLPHVIRQIAEDIGSHYQDILTGDVSAWRRISTVAEEWKQVALKDRAEYERKNAHPFERRHAADAFRRKDYEAVVTLLQPIADVLDEIECKKLAYARKQAEGRKR